ncbi:hypothetical protein [Nocardia sp. NBC_01388]
MTSQPAEDRLEDNDTRPDDDKHTDAEQDAPATTEDQAANMDYEGDIPK